MNQYILTSKRNHNINYSYLENSKNHKYDIFFNIEHHLQLLVILREYHLLITPFNSDKIICKINKVIFATQKKKVIFMLFKKKVMVKGLTFTAS